MRHEGYRPMNQPTSHFVSPGPVLQVTRGNSAWVNPRAMELNSIGERAEVSSSTSNKRTLEAHNYEVLGDIDQFYAPDSNFSPLSASTPVSTLYL